MAGYKLSFTAEIIDDKLQKVQEGGTGYTEDDTVHHIDQKYLPEAWHQLLADVENLKERVSTLENGNTGGGGSSAEQFIVEFDQYGEYGSYDFAEVLYFQVSDEVPTFEQLKNSELYVYHSEIEDKLVITDYYGEGSDYWTAYYKEEFAEVGSPLVIVVPTDTSWGQPAGVYVNFDYINSMVGDSWESGYILFPEVKA